MSEDSKDIPTYSLLEKHDDQVVYRIPDPAQDSEAWVRVGLFFWELEGVPIGKTLADEFTDEDLELVIERSDGIGIHLDFNRPTRFHPSPSNYVNRVQEAHEVFSHGSGGMRIEDATPNELREIGRWVGLYAFAYWWWVEEHTEYPIGKKGTREEMWNPRLETVLEDGTVIEQDGTTHDSPYTLGGMELRAPSEWASPKERATDAIQGIVDSLLDDQDLPPKDVIDACRDVEDTILSVPEKTEAKKGREELVDALRSGDDVGRATRRKITREFDTVEELCEDIRNGSERLRDLNNIGDSREDAIIDALIESGYWQPVEEPAE